MTSASRIRHILAELDGYVADAPLCELAGGADQMRVGEARDALRLALGVLEARAVAEHGSVAA